MANLIMAVLTNGWSNYLCHIKYQQSEIQNTPTVFPCLDA